MSARARRYRRERESLAHKERSYEQYRNDPFDYSVKVLKAEWWSKQQLIAESLTRPPYRTLVKASFGVGKSYVAGGLVNWWYDTRNPSVGVTTAPTAKQVAKVLWKEIRRQRRGRGGFIGPKAPELWSAEDHYAIGMTGDKSEAFQGQHEAAVLGVLDEAVGVEAFIWEAFDSLMMGVEYAFLAICNPTDPGSEFYRREQQTEIPYTVISITCLEHPNIAKELHGEAPDYPAAVRLAWVDERIREWCDPLGGGEPAETDILWPALPGQPGGPAWIPVYGTALGEPKWYRPGPEAEAKLLGRWPSRTAGVWSDALWGRCELLECEPPHNLLPVIGSDIARFGDDDTATHVRCGNVSLQHESVNGQPIDATAGRLKILAGEWAAWATARRAPQAKPVDAKEIQIRVDDSGVGGGVTDLLRAAGFNVIPINAASRPKRGDKYPNVRGELWFDGAERASKGKLSVARLDAHTRNKIKIQAMAPQWKLNAAGQRVVEAKEETKRRTGGQSPDQMDALNLAYYEPGSGPSASWGDAEPPANPLRPSPPPSDRMPDDREPEPMRLYGR